MVVNIQFWRRSGDSPHVLPARFCTPLEPAMMRVATVRAAALHARPVNRVA
jgi:hypothetical protein